VKVLEIQYAPAIIGAAVLHATAPVASGGCGLEMHIRSNESLCKPFLGSEESANVTVGVLTNTTMWAVAPPVAPAAGTIFCGDVALNATCGGYVHINVS
jgi:hypothetical protein